MTFKIAKELSCIKCGGYVCTTSAPEDAICDNCNKHTLHFSTKISTRQKENIPENIRWDVYERDNFTCQICGSRRNLTIDHIYPEALGGVATLENCQTLCRSCNSRKGVK